MRDTKKASRTKLTKTMTKKFNCPLYSSRLQKYGKCSFFQKPVTLLCKLFN